MSPEDGLTSAGVYGLLVELDRWTVGRFGELAEPFQLLVVGGAAIAMQWNPGRVTYDVDVVSEGLPADIWVGAASVAAGQEGVRSDWLNAAAKMKALSPIADADPTLVYEGTNLRVYGAGARYVMAMKAVAGRPIDLADLPAVLVECRFASLDEALRWVSQAHSHRQIPVAARYILEAAWADLEARGLVPATGPTVGEPAELWVRPASQTTSGWEIELRRAGREPVSRGVLYPLLDDALHAAEFARTVLDTPEPLRLGAPPDRAEYQEPSPDNCRTVVLPVPQDGAWVLQATGSDGEQRAVSPPYPTLWQAQSAQSVLAGSRAELGAPEGRNPVQVRASAVCACLKLGSVCLHFETPTPDTRPPERGRFR